MNNRISLLIILTISGIITVSSCCNKAEKKTGNTTAHTETVTLASNNYGAKITKTGAMETKELPSMFTSDTAQVKLTGKIVEVCQHSGCWLTVAYGNEEIMVNMKDEFSVPKDISGKTVWLDGIAVRQLVSVETLKKLAVENRQSQDEIDAITQPVYDYTIEATGVIVE
jgi:hypothetical protein